MPLTREVSREAEARLNWWTSIATVLPTLAIGNRLYTLEILASEGETSASALADHIGHALPVVVSQLRAMKVSRLVADAGGDLYRITDRGRAFVAALATLERGA